jgi:hypothetical protein
LSSGRRVTATEGCSLGKNPTAAKSACQPPRWASAQTGAAAQDRGDLSAGAACGPGRSARGAGRALRQAAAGVDGRGGAEALDRGNMQPLFLRKGSLGGREFGPQRNHRPPSAIWPRYQQERVPRGQKRSRRRSPMHRGRRARELELPGGHIWQSRRIVVAPARQRSRPRRAPDRVRRSLRPGAHAPGSAVRLARLGDQINALLRL